MFLYHNTETLILFESSTTSSTSVSSAEVKKKPLILHHICLIKKVRNAIMKLWFHQLLIFRKVFSEFLSQENSFQKEATQRVTDVRTRVSSRN